MTIEIKDEVTVIKDVNLDFDSLLKKINLQEKNLSNSNIILDLNAYQSVNVKDLAIFYDYAAKIKKSKYSFIIVSPIVDFNKVSSKLNVAPTLKEAYDIIELEAIERDLGF